MVNYSKFRMVSQQSLGFLIKVPSIGILSGPPFENLCVCVCVCSCKGDLMNRSCSRKGDKNEGTENTDVPIITAKDLISKQILKKNTRASTTQMIEGGHR